MNNFCAMKAKSCGFEKIKLINNGPSVAVENYN